MENKAKENLKEDENSFENLCFEGGGVRGFAYCGAIKALDDAGLLSGMKRFTGTSVGSVFAALLATGFTADEMMSIKEKLDFSVMSSGCCISTAYSIIVNYGIHVIDAIEGQIRDILKVKVDPEITLKQLYENTNKELVIVASCLNREKGVYLHHANFPNVKLIEAIISSISVPFLFQPRKYDFLGSRDYYVDGGLVDNYPLWIFNDVKALYNDDLANVEREDINSKTLGLKLLGSDEKNNTEVFDGRNVINSAVGIGSGIINTLMMQIERAEISPSYIKNTVPIFTGNVGFMDFEISDDTIDFLINSGEKSVVKYFE